MSEINLVAGTFRDFRANVKFHLGRLQVDIPEGQVVQYDGQILRVSGQEHPYPEIRSTIKAGWLVPIGDSVSDYIPVSAGITVRPAQDTTKVKQSPTTVSGEETYVGPATKAGAVKKAAEVTTTSEGLTLKGKTFNSSLVKDTEGDGRTVGQAIKPKVTASSPTPSSEGTPVAKLKRASKTSFSMDGSTSMNAGEPTEDVTGVVEHLAPPAKVIRPQAGPKADLLASKGGIVAAAADSVEEILDAVDPATHAQMLAIQRKKQVAASTPSVATPVVKVAKPVAAAVKVVAKAPTSVEDVVINGDSLEIAPGIRWDKKIHWKSRVKIAVDQYRNSPDVLALIKSYEVPSVVRGIDEALAFPPR